MIASVVSWAVIAFASPGDTLDVTWWQKYGVVREEKCMAVFSDGRRYKLVAPWLNTVIINESNINDIEVRDGRSK